MSSAYCSACGSTAMITSGIAHNVGCPVANGRPAVYSATIMPCESCRALAAELARVTKEKDEAKANALTWEDMARSERRDADAALKLAEKRKDLLRRVQPRECDATCLVCFEDEEPEKCYRRFLRLEIDAALGKCATIPATRSTE